MSYLAQGALREGVRHRHSRSEESSLRMEHGTWSGGSRAGLAFSVGFAYEISTELAGGKELTG